MSSGPRCHLKRGVCEGNSAVGSRRSTPRFPERGSVVSWAALLRQYVHCEAFFFWEGGGKRGLGRWYDTANVTPGNLD